MAFPEKLLSFFQDRFGNLPDEKKQRIVLVFTAGIVVVLVLSVVLSLRSPDKEEPPAEAARLDSRIVIPLDDIFLPDEPDFIPGVLLGRDKRSAWTEQDAEEYWLDPLRYGEEQWREKIEMAVDDFLERVP